MQDKSRFTISELKRIKRQASKAHAKLKRKVETMRKLREDIFELSRQTGNLRGDLANLSDPSYQPPPKDYVPFCGTKY